MKPRGAIARVAPRVPENPGPPEPEQQPTRMPSSAPCYVATGNNYSAPQAFLECVSAAADNPNAQLACTAPYADNLFDATSLRIPGLTTVGGNVYVRNSSLLTTLSFPDLTSAFGINVRDNRALTTLELPSLSEVSWFNVTDNPNLAQCDIIDMARALFTPPPASGGYCVEQNADDCPDEC